MVYTIPVFAGPCRQTSYRPFASTECGTSGKEPHAIERSSPAITSRQSTAHGQQTFHRPVLSVNPERVKHCSFAAIADRVNGWQPRGRPPVPAGGQLFWQTQVPAAPKAPRSAVLLAQRPRLVCRSARGPPIFFLSQKNIQGVRTTGTTNTRDRNTPAMSFTDRIDPCCHR
jgi:hypothetical protein